MEENRRPFGVLPDGRKIEAVTLRDGPLSCAVLTYGGIVRSLTVPDRDGKPVDVALGFDTLEDYLRQDKYIGALVGRCANRTAGASFVLNGKEYPLPANDGPNHLHGGKTGFDRRVWTVESVSGNSLTLSLFSPDGEEGYPGGLAVEVTYLLTGGCLEISYLAHAQADTVCNLTSHTYFNLSGHGSGTVANHLVQVFAGHYTPIGPGSIPTGEIAPVADTPMDLRTPRNLGESWDLPFPQLALAGGYDHNWVIDGEAGVLRPFAKVYAPDTGITLELEATLPGVQLYTGNYLDGCPAGKGGAEYPRRGGLCLETQFFPDSLHHPGFPSPILRSGETWKHTARFRFGAK